MTPAYLVVSWLEGPVLVLLAIGALVMRVLLDGNRDWSDGLSGGTIFGSDRPRTPNRPKVRLRPRETAPPAAALASRQWQDESTGEITAQDLDESDQPRRQPAAGATQRPMTDEEELELIRERRWRVRQRLPQIAEQMHAQWEALADSLRLLSSASVAVPGEWKRLTPAPGAKSSLTEPDWEVGGAGPLSVGAEELAQHDVVDRNHNGIPDQLELPRGQSWSPLSYSERAWRSVLEAEQGPAVILSGMLEQMNELFAAQSLMGYPLRLQGPLEEVRGIILRAFAACDERVPAQQRQDLREGVQVFLERDLPRMRANLGAAAQQIHS